MDEMTEFTRNGPRGGKKDDKILGREGWKREREGERESGHRGPETGSFLLFFSFLFFGLIFFLFKEEAILYEELFLMKYKTKRKMKYFVQYVETFSLFYLFVCFFMC